MSKKKSQKPSKRAWCGTGALLVAALGGTIAVWRDTPSLDSDLQNTQVTSQDVYGEWMDHYDPKGVLLKDILKAPSFKKKFDELQRHPTKSKELIVDPSLQLLANPKYALFRPEHLFVYSHLESGDEEKTIKWFYQTKATQLKGRQKVLDSVPKYKELSDDLFSEWAFNAAFYVARANFKTTPNVSVFTKEAMLNTWQQGLGDCGIFTYLTHSIYTDIVYNAGRKKSLI